VATRERDILERALQAVSEQAAAASAIVDEALEAGLDGSHPVTLQAKMLRLELLKVKADLERELGRLVLDCSSCSQTVHWVAGLGVSPGHWAHREAAPHHEPAVLGLRDLQGEAMSSGEYDGEDGPRGHRCA
jgi:hypothetical protein